MTFIRPEARAALWKWRELLIAAAVGLLGVNWVTGPGGLLVWIGWGVLACAALIAIIGIQRARFRSGSGGPGMVQVDEGQIAYFGPLTGGAIAVSELERLILDPTGKPRHWRLTQPGQPDLDIPINAEGAESLFDAFSALPGFNTHRMLGQLQNPGPHPVVIWERTPLRPTGRLHS